jgi:hypothetical protein
MPNQSPKAQVSGGKAAQHFANAFRSRRGDRSTFTQSSAEIWRG